MKRRFATAPTNGRADTRRLAQWLALVAVLILLGYGSRISSGKPDPQVLYEWSTAIGGNGGGYAASDLNAAQAELERLAQDAGGVVAELEALGVVVKDLDTGLLDFPALRDGEEVELCWQLGERSVAHWHELGVGYAGRKPIDWDE